MHDQCSQRKVVGLSRDGERKDLRLVVVILVGKGNFVENVSPLVRQPVERQHLRPSLPRPPPLCVCVCVCSLDCLTCSNDNGPRRLSEREGERASEGVIARVRERERERSRKTLEIERRFLASGSTSSSDSTSMQSCRKLL